MAPVIRPAKPQTTEPASLLSQWWSMGKIALDRRTKGRHIKVGWVIIERFMRAKGGGRASIRFIQTATGLSPRIIVKACNELVEWGHCSRIIGVGTRPTEYMPNWAIVSPMYIAKAAEPSVSQECNTSASPPCNAEGDSASPMYIESCLPSRLTKPADGKAGNDSSHAAPTAPPGPPASAAVRADAARVPDRFEEFWRAYPKKLKKAKARAAYEKIAPDADLHTRIVEKASELASHHKNHGTESRWIKEPANWLAGEGWDEDLPSVYDDPKDAAIAKKRASPPKPTVPANENMPPLRTNWDKVEVIASEVVARAKGNALVMTLRSTDGSDCYTETIILEDASQDIQDDGQRQFSKLRQAMGVEDIYDTEQLHGIPFERRINAGKSEYRAIAADVAA